MEKLLKLQAEISSVILRRILPIITMIFSLGRIGTIRTLTSRPGVSLRWWR